MAQITQKELEHLSNEEIRQFYKTEHIDDCKIPVIKDYVLKGKENFTMSNRINRVEALLNNIIVKRFFNNEI